MISHTLIDGKYTVTFYDNGKMEALRYGEKWRDLTGDGMILALLQKIDDLKLELASTQELLNNQKSINPDAHKNT